MPTHAIQELVVTKDMSTLTVYSSDGNITERFEKNLTPVQFNSIVKVFIDNNFASFGDRYDEGQNYVTDVGFTDITFSVNGKAKTVTTYNVNAYLPSGLIAIREKVQETVEYTRALDESQIKALAESWIREAPTYKYDGSGLVLVDYVQQESYPRPARIYLQFHEQPCRLRRPVRPGDCTGDHEPYDKGHDYRRRRGFGDHRRGMGRDGPVHDWI